MKKVFVFVLLLFAVFPLNIHAQTKNDEDSAVKMGEVVVTATRDKQETRKTPANVTVITAEDISKSGATTVVDVLDNLEGIQFRTSSGNSSQAYIDMRGIGGDNPYGKVLILLDGRRLNRTDISSINWLQIPVNNIERIEIIRGPGSVLYGDAAIGGVINIITKKGKTQPQFNASTIVGSYGLNDERVSLIGATDKWTYSINGENNFNFGYRERSKYSAQSGGLDFGYSASDLFNVSLGVSFIKTDYQMPGALTKAQIELDRRQYQPAGWAPAHFNDDGSDKYANVNLGIKSFFGSWGQLEINFLYGRKDLQVDMSSWFLFANTSTDTYGITPKYVLTKEIFGFNNKVVLGIDYYYEPYKKDFFGDRERTSKTSTADFTRESQGYYVRDEFSILKNLIVSTGYRLERASIEGSNLDFAPPPNTTFPDQTKKYTAEAYETGLTWLMGKKSKVFAKYSTIYRIPFLDEVASFNGGGGGFLPDLEKEKGSSVEAGTEFYPLTNLKIGLTIFRIDMEDEIQYVGFFPTGHNQNAGKTRHDGAEVSFSYLWEKHALLYGNFTYHKATYDDGANNKKELWLVPNRLATLGLEIYLPFNFMLRPEVRYVGDCFLSQDFNNVGEKLDSYTLLNIYLSYKPPLEKVKMTAFLGVENLGDVKYSSFGMYGAPWSDNTYYPMPGITFKGGLSFDF
jgi:iron complex outermembrane recepter protein